MDFSSALAQLLSHGTLRDAFAQDPDEVLRPWALSPSDHSALRKVTFDDLEFQARVLLRKRFRALEPQLPRTLALLGPEAWPRFAAYARTNWPPSPLHDAHGFCQAVAPDGSAEERHRLNFLVKNRRVLLALHRQPWRLQCVLRTRRGWREWVVGF